jgi:hypothetical protein
VDQHLVNLVTGGSNKLVLGATAHTIFSGTNGSVRALDIDSSGNLGVGTSTPGSFQAGANNLVVGTGSGDNGISIFAGASNEGRLYFARTGELVRGQVKYDFSADKMYFAVDSATKATLTSTGLGIGTTSPGTPLHIAAQYPSVRFQSNTGSYQQRSTVGQFDNIMYIECDNDNAVASSAMAFTVDASEKIRIDANGRLLLRTGTTDASNLSGGFENALQVEGLGATTSSISITRNSNDDNPAYLNFGKSRGTSLGSNVAVAQDDTLAQIDFNGSDGSGSFNPFASIRTQVDGAPGNADSPGRLRFYTTSDGSSSPASAGRWTIHSDGVLKSGAADSGYLSGAMKIDGTRKIIFGSGNAGAIGTAAQGSGNAAVDTGISVNRGNAGGSAILLWNGNFSNGTSTVSALYFIKFYYDGNNTPALTLIHGDNNLSIGQSASNTMTLTPSGNYNWTMTIFFGD